MAPRNKKDRGARCSMDWRWESEDEVSAEKLTSMRKVCEYLIRLVYFLGGFLLYTLTYLLICLYHYISISHITI